MSDNWDKLKEYVLQNKAVWSLTVASASPEDRLLSYYRGREESVNLLLEKMDELDGTTPKKQNCCT